MNEKLNIRLGSPVVMFFRSFAMLLLGIAIGENWEPSRMRAVAIAVATWVSRCCMNWCVFSCGAHCRRGGSANAWGNSRVGANNEFGQQRRGCTEGADAVQLPRTRTR